MERHRRIWRLGLGAEVLDTKVRFRVWAPKCKQVDVVIENQSERIVSLEQEGDGYFSQTVPDVRPGWLYKYRLNKDQKFPDPCSRFQPEGPDGPSMVVDPTDYRWQDFKWPGVEMAGQVIYELHVGAFTREGTFDAAARELQELKRLGVTLIELMPVAEFSGRWNWGYDGVDLYAPARAYGDPEALKRFVDSAHAHGLGVILDVVYNHLGPDGNYLGKYSDFYFTDRHKTDWGAAINFDGPGCREVREFFIRNACYWISEFHMDGLRLDATQNIYDSGPTHILSDLSRRAREVAQSRRIVLIAENETQEIICLAPTDKGGYGLDGVWSDDFHHSIRVALTGHREAYYIDYRGGPQELISAVKRGFLYQGQPYRFYNKPRGSAVTKEPARAFVFFLQNHDQVANSLHGERIHTLTTAARHRAVTGLWLLAPETPLLFMGQEFAASSPFLFFADHPDPTLANNVYEGRKKFLSKFASYATPEAQAQVPNPCAASTFERSKLNLSERTSHIQIYRLHQDLLRLRREDPVIAAQDRERIDGAVLGPGALVLRYFGSADEDRLLVVNLGTDLEYDPAPEPLLAPIPGGTWQLLWSSNDLRYGGPGIINPCTPERWKIPGEITVLFAARK